MKPFLKFFLPLFFLFLALPDAGAENRAVFHPSDRLVKPGEAVMLRARLMSGGLGFLQRPISGERVEFLIGDRLIGEALTGGNGWAVKRFRPDGEGNMTVMVRLAESSDYRADPAELILSIGPASRTLLLVHLSATRSPSAPPAIPFSPLPTPEPAPGAVEELEALSEKYQPVYLETGPENLTPRFREWIFGQGFPEGPFFVWPAKGSPEARKESFENRILELREEGWKGIRAGITRSPSEAGVLAALNISSVLLVEEDYDPEETPEGVEALSGWPEVSSFLKGRGDGPGNP